MQTLFQNLRYGFRLLRTKPGFTIVAVLTLALGIGANTAIFTVVDAALLRSLPYKDPERLVHLWEATEQQQTKQRELSYPDFLDLKQHSQVFEGVAGYNGRNVTLTHGEVKERLQATRVTSNFFSILGVEAALGRTFQPEEDRPGAPALVILNHNLWQRRFSGDPNLIGQAINLNGTNYTVVGILPPHFQFAPIADAELWVPLNPSANEVSRRFTHWLNVIARLKPGLTVEQARAGTQVIAQRLAEADPQFHQGAMIRIIALRDQIVGAVKPLLLVLLGTVAFVLLIACANIANLLLTRAAARHKEIAVRLALGATRWHLVKQLLTESMLLALLGGALGLFLARWGIDLIVAAIPQSQMNFGPGLAIDLRALAFTGALSLLTGVIFGLAPALQASKADLQESLKEGSRTSSIAASNRLRSMLIVSEIALALVLLVGAGLMTKSLLRLLDVDPGFDPKNLLTFQLSLPSAKYGANNQAPVFYQQLLTRLETLPGVKGAGAVNRLPLVGGSTGVPLIEGRPAPAPGQEPVANVRTVSFGYFRAMGIPLIKGRVFTEQDQVGAPRVLMVNQTLAAQLFSGQNAIGQRIRFTFTGDQPFEIVGVVGDEKVTPLDTATTPVIYFPHLQNSDLAMNMVVRTATDPLAFASTVRSEVRAMDADLLVYHIESMEHHIAMRPSTMMRRYPTMLIGAFAAIALLLAVIGIYGIISYSVSQRTHELAIRIALGAGRRDILKLVVGQGLGLTAAGIGIGLAAAFMLTSFLSSMLFEVGTSDPLIFIGVAMLLAAVALLASYLPARRATKVDPMVALRCE